MHAQTQKCERLGLPATPPKANSSRACEGRRPRELQAREAVGVRRVLQRRRVLRRPMITTITILGLALFAAVMLFAGIANLTALRITNAVVCLCLVSIPILAIGALSDRALVTTLNAEIEQAEQDA